MGIDKIRLLNPANLKKENDVSRLFEQYRLYLASTESISSKRSQANNLFILINSALLSLVGFIFQAGIEKNGWILPLITIVGALTCLTSGILINSYKQLNSAKFMLVHEIEKQLPLNLYSYEWVLLGEGKDPKKYFPFSHVEMLLPWIFGIMYLIIFIIFLRLR